MNKPIDSQIDNNTIRFEEEGELTNTLTPRVIEDLVIGLGGRED